MYLLAPRLARPDAVVPVVPVAAAGGQQRAHAALALEDDVREPARAPAVRGARPPRRGGAVAAWPFHAGNR